MYCAAQDAVTRGRHILKYKSHKKNTISAENTILSKKQAKFHPEVQPEGTMFDHAYGSQLESNEQGTMFDYHIS